MISGLFLRTNQGGVGCRRTGIVPRGDLLDILEHPNTERYAGQRIVVVQREDYVYQREDYVYLVPFVEDEQRVFLKTIIPSRKATKAIPR